MNVEEYLNGFYKGTKNPSLDAMYFFMDRLGNLHKNLRVIHIAENKIELNKRNQKLDEYKLTNVTPISMSITNLIESKPKENYLIVNIEQNTTITKIIDQKVYDIMTLEEGCQNILNNINLKENSYSKSYEICKNATIYTNENRDLQYEENMYLDDIMPTLYEIVGKIRKITNESLNRINKVYITGTASVINNIDIYFQEYLTDVECEILQPYFVYQKNSKINMKDYIEVNSAISLALAGLGEMPENINFK